MPWPTARATTTSCLCSSVYRGVSESTVHPPRHRTHVRLGAAMADLPIPELVENRRRSIAMLTPGVPALNREEALELLEQLEEAQLRLGELEAAIPDTTVRPPAECFGLPERLRFGAHGPTPTASFEGRVAAIPPAPCPLVR
jgi:hypothetical protein